MSTACNWCFPISRTCRIQRPFGSRFASAGIVRAVVTFSGQEFQIAGERVEVLADAQERVMLVGDRFFWSSAEPNRAAANLHIQAHPLIQTL